MGIPRPAFILNNLQSLLTAIDPQLLVFFQLFEDLLLELMQRVLEASVVFLMGEDQVGLEVLENALSEQMDTFEVQFLALQVVRHAHHVVLLLTLLRRHLLDHRYQWVLRLGSTHLLGCVEQCGANHCLLPLQRITGDIFQVLCRS